jgi:hypothetical protein
MGRLQNNPSIGWVHPKYTHAHPLTWDNKNNDMFLHYFTLTCLVFYIYNYTNVDKPYTFTLNVNKFHYGIYTYIKCKS